MAVIEVTPPSILSRAFVGELSVHGLGEIVFHLPDQCFERLNPVFFWQVGEQSLRVVRVVG